MEEITLTSQSTTGIAEEESEEAGSLNFPPDPASENGGLKPGKQFPLVAAPGGINPLTAYGS